MNLVKWLRKNNKKVMAVVVIVIMFGFIGGSYIQQLGERRTGLHKTVAYFGDNRKITHYDRTIARRELDTLRMLRADVLLKNIGAPLTQTQDLPAFLLGEVLFSERTTSPRSVTYIKRLIRYSNYRISDKQIDDLYNRSMGNETYWLLLKREAALAGIKISEKVAARQLTGAISAFARRLPDFQGLTYQGLVGAIMKRQRIAEKEVQGGIVRACPVRPERPQLASSQTNQKLYRGGKCHFRAASTEKNILKSKYNFAGGKVAYRGRS